MEQVELSVPAPSPRRRSRHQKLLDRYRTAISDQRELMKGFEMKRKQQRKFDMQNKRLDAISNQLASVLDKPKREIKRAPDSGISKPHFITDPDFLTFMGQDESEPVKQPSVTSMVWKYIRENNLRDNDKNIVPDAILANILGIEDERIIKHGEIQKLISARLKSMQ